MVRCPTPSALAAGRRRPRRAVAVALARRPARASSVRELVATLQCAGNRRAGLIAVRDIPGEIPWGPGATGTAALARRRAGGRARAAGLGRPRAAPHRADSRATSYEVSIPLRKALAGEVLLAWEMNGEPLTPAHGAPLRALVPGYIGARSVKWLTGVRALAEPSQGYFQAGAPTGSSPGSIALGAVAVNADILVPADGAVGAAGPLEVVGYAFAGDDRRSCGVDVSRRRRRARGSRPSCSRTSGRGPGGAGGRRWRSRPGRSSSSRGRGTAPPRPSPRTPPRSGTPAATPTMRGRACASAWHHHLDERHRAPRRFPNRPQAARAARLPARGGQRRARPGRRRRHPARDLRRSCGAGWPILVADHRRDLLHGLQADASASAQRTPATPTARPSAPTISATIARPLPPSSSVVADVRSAATGVAVAGRGGAVLGRGRGHGDDRGGVVGALGADPAHDLAAAVGLQRLEGQLVAGLAGDLARERPKSWKAPGGIASSSPSAVQVIVLDALGDLAVVGLDRRRRACSVVTLTRPAGDGLVGRGLRSRPGTGPRPWSSRRRRARWGRGRRGA